MKAPILELKSVKHSAFASQETYCYEATLYVDGKKWGKVRNDGTGGCDYQYPDKGVEPLSDLEARIKATVPKRQFPAEWGGGDYQPHLETLCHELVTDWLQDKEFKGSMKRRILYVKEGERGVFQMPAKYKPTPEILHAIKANCAWAKGCTFLHELPEGEAKRLYFSNL